MKSLTTISNNSSNNYRYLNIIFLLFILVFVSSCRLGKTIYHGKINDKTGIIYSLRYNNRSARHKPIALYVAVGELNTRTSNLQFYIFHINSDTVEKSSTVSKVKENFVLSKELSEENSTNPVIPISGLESEIFDKIIYYSDSLKLKDFRYLKKAKGFLATTQKFGDLLRSK